MKKEYKAVVFDLDGTLYESHRFPLYLILRDPLHMRLLGSERVSRKKIQGQHFKTAEAYYDELFKIMGDNAGVKWEKASKWFWDRYMPNMIRIIRTHYTARHHAKQLIDKLRSRGIKLAVLSDYAMVNEKLVAAGYQPTWFDGVYEAPAVGGLKPCPETFRNVCGLLDVDPKDALMIGDKMRTDGGAMTIGMDFMHVINKEDKRGAKKTDPSGAQSQDLLWSEILRYFGV